MAKSLETYLKQLQLGQLFNELNVSDSAALARTVQHFTVREAENRDKIVAEYFGKPAINRIVEAITESLLTPPRLSPHAKILDVGAGSGFFTVKIAERIRAELPEADFYAMDLTPAMLLSLAKKNAKITPFIGTAENIEGMSNRQESPSKFLSGSMQPSPR